jgi:hypothetical protein
MALVLADRVQESTTTTGTGSIALAGAVLGYQSFAVIGNGNTTYYTIADQGGSNWEVGIGTYSTSGPTLARTTVLSNSNGNTSPVNFTAGTKTVFVTYPSEKSVNLNEFDNVILPSGLIAENAAIITPAILGGTSPTAQLNQILLQDGFGAKILSLDDGLVRIQTGVTGAVEKTFTFDNNGNLTLNRLNQANTTTTAAGGTTALTVASSYVHTLVGTVGQTYTLPDATTLTTGVAFLFNNLATGTLTIQDYATATIGTIPAGGAGAVFLTNNATVGGTWDLHAYLPEGVTFGTNAFNLGTAIVSGGTWQGGTIQPAYGGTGLTTFAAANNAIYSTGASTLTAGTLPVAAGGTGRVSATEYALVCGGTTSTGPLQSVASVGTTGQLLTSNGAGALPTFQTASFATPGEALFLATMMG